MAANKKNNINVDRPIIHQVDTMEVSLFVFVRIVISQTNQRIWFP